MFVTVSIDRPTARRAAQYLARCASLTASADRALAYADLADLLTAAHVDDTLTTAHLTATEARMLAAYRPLAARIAEALA